jgi:plasmid stabilization system protein ParE
VARVLVTPAAADDLEQIIRTRLLPEDARDRIRRSLEPLERFPVIGTPLEGRWTGFRFILGPWRWLIAVYVFDEQADVVSIVTIQDSRTESTAIAR